jgi:hypothetical protein
VIVAEFFDIDKSRSIAQQRRLEARHLLAALAEPNRDSRQSWSGAAGVLRQPVRQHLPLFAHYGVPLWVPEVGGLIDPGDEAYDLIMSVSGGVSKGERNRSRSTYVTLPRSMRFQLSPRISLPMRDLT